MKFDVILTNPPFQDTRKRGRTPHKLWIEFTSAALNCWLRDDGWFAQISPSSFRSPNSKVLELMKTYDTHRISFDTRRFFPKIGSTFADYVIQKAQTESFRSVIVDDDGKVDSVSLDLSIRYLPNPCTAIALNVHRKVMFTERNRLPVEWDYVTNHNVRLRKADTLNTARTERHIYPLLHTNRQIWWSSIRQEFSSVPKVMWSRSGTTEPFYDAGELGTTDMGYFVRVAGTLQGNRLVEIFASKLFRYILATARWSGYGNERVFQLLPVVPDEVGTSDNDLFDWFEMDAKEILYVERYLDRNRSSRRNGAAARRNSANQATHPLYR